MTKPRKPRQPPLTLKDLAPYTANLTPEQIRNRLSLPSRHLEDMISKIDAGLTPKEREVLKLRFATEPKKPPPTTAIKPSVLGGFIGSVFGKTGNVIGSFIEWTADAFKRVHDDLQRALVERDEARADARALYESYMGSRLPPQEVVQRVAAYPAPKKDEPKP
jgi:hypothetical protein